VTGTLNGLFADSVAVTVVKHWVPHTPPTQTKLPPHATAVPHWPQPLHVWTPVVPEHCVAPGMHTGDEGHEQVSQAQLGLQDWFP